MTVETTLVIADVVVGGFLVGAACGRRLPSTSRSLLAAAGAAWWLGDVVPAAVFLHRAVLIHLVLSYPTGRVRGPTQRAAVALGYGYAATYALPYDDVLGTTVAAVVVLVALHRAIVAHGPERRSTVVAVAAAVGLAAAFVVGPVTRFAGIEGDLVEPTYDLLLAAVAALILLDVLLGRWAPAALTGLVVDLGEAAGSDVVRDCLAKALGDPGLVIGYWLPAQRRYVDESGAAVELPRSGDEQVMTPVVVEGQPLAVLVHDASVLGDPRLLADVTAAARWAVANVRLRAEVRERVDNVEASRRRIVTAADDERRRLEERLRHGPEGRLARVAQLVGADGSCLGQLAPAVDRARADLRELAHGIHPRSLTEGGLSAGLRELADRSPVPVRLEVAAVRLPAAIEAAAYFVCAESLTNMVKYARASHVQVRVTRHEGHVSVVVADDGDGGADPGLGTGLRGLSDRAETLGGRLLLQSPVGGGTRVIAELPVAASVPSVARMPTCPR